MKKENIFQRLFNYINNDVVKDRSKRKQMELLIISGVFFLAGTVFTIINFAGSTKELTLGWVTLSFGLISLLTALCAIFFKKWMFIAEILFVISALIMFGYFMIAGGAGDNGFSTYWILLLPFIAMMVLGLVKGSAVIALMFAAICILLWIPAVRDNVLTWKPDHTFIVRFPLVYLAAGLASILFEWSRSLIDKSNRQLTDKLEGIAKHDPLTGLSNRYGMNEIVNNVDFNNALGCGEFKRANCILIDVDNFKSANDLYGHMFGDKVLVEIAKILRNHAGECAVRFGGDEFVLLFANKSDAEMMVIAENIRKEVEAIVFEEHPEVKYTVSVGVASHDVDKDYDVTRVIELADIQSSRAKKQGKNRVYVLDFDQIKNDRDLLN